MTVNSQTSIEILEKRIAFLERENKILKEREFTILRALPEIVFIIDFNERFVFLNDTAREKFKLEKNILDYNIHLKDIIMPESIFSLRKIYFQEPKSDSFHAREIKGFCCDGSSFLFTAYFSPLYEGDTKVGFIGVGFDITERIEIENKLTEANLAKMKFLSIIAHDLRNPFNSLLGFSNLLLANFDSYSTEKIKEYVSHMNNSAAQGHQLLENLLDWARANMRKIDVQPAAHFLSTIVHDTVALIAGSISKKEQNLVLELTDNVNIYADQNMVRTVIRNLLSNAVKFTPRKGNIKIRTGLSGKMAFVEVIDSGIGISQENLPNLFSLSNEITTLGTERERGTGLGLILCYEFITLNKGTIEAHSVHGQGSTFRINLPLLHTVN